MKPLPSTGPQIAKILEELHDVFWELEADEKAEHIRYTDADVMHALKIFTHVASNVRIHRMMEEGISVENGKKKMYDYGARLANLVLEMTGIDSQKFYDK